MLLQPADFYSYSRATGIKPPENDQERAAMAVDVIDFKRNQLRPPSSEDNEGRDLSLIALGAGIIGSIVGGRKIMKGFESRTPTPTKKVSFEQPAEIAKLNRRNNQKLQQDLSFVDEALKKVEKDAYPEYTKQELEALQGIDREVKGLREVKPSKIVESPTNVEKQQIDNTSTSTEQVKNRAVTEQVNRDVQSIREGKTNQLKAEAISKALNNSDFANFSQDAVKIKETVAAQEAAAQRARAVDKANIQKLENYIFETGPFSEGRLEAIAKRNEQTPDMTAFALTGRASELGLSRQRLKELGLKPKDELFGNLSQREADRRLLSAADPSVSPEQAKKLMDPNYSSTELMKEGLLDLSPEPINPDLELTAGGSQAFNLNRQRRARPQATSLDAIDDAYDAELAKIGMEQNMAGKVGIYATKNPQRGEVYEQFAKSWDSLARAGFVLPREETIDGKTYKYADLKYMRVNKFNANPIDVENYRQSGKRLSKLAREYGLDKIPETEIVVTNPQTLQEIRTVKERSRKSGKSILTDEVQYDDLGKVGEGKERSERQVRKENFTGESRAIRPRGGVLYDSSGERQFVQSQVSYPGSTADLIGGYKTGEPIKYFRFGGKISQEPVYVEGKYIGTYLAPYTIQKGDVTRLNPLIGRMDNPVLSKLPQETYDPSTNVLNIQPYSVTTKKKVKTSLSQKTGMPRGEDFVVDDFIYGELVERKKVKDAMTGAMEEKLVPTSVPLNKMQDLAYRARAGIEDIDLSDPEKRKTYYSKIADKMYAMAKNPVKLTEKQIQAGMVAGIGKDLPVLQDFRTQGQFIKNLLTVEGESEAFGRRAKNQISSPYTVTDRDKYVYDKAKPDKVKLPGYRIPKGLGGVTDQEIEAGQIRVNIGGGQRAAGAQKLRQALQDFKTRTGKPVSRSQLFKLAQPLARQYNTDINSLINLAGIRRGGGLRG
jgi:hypothetical protein